MAIIELTSEAVIRDAQGTERKVEIKTGVAGGLTLDLVKIAFVDATARAERDGFTLVSLGKLTAVVDSNWTEGKVNLFEQMAKRGQA